VNQGRTVFSRLLSFLPDREFRRCAGNKAAESKRAIEWMELALYHPDWRVENLPRIRDFEDRALDGLRRNKQGNE
jgi:hypothetical protein